MSTDRFALVSGQDVSPGGYDLRILEHLGQHRQECLIHELIGTQVVLRPTKGSEVRNHPDAKSVMVVPVCWIAAIWFLLGGALFSAAMIIEASNTITRKIA